MNTEQENKEKRLLKKTSSSYGIMPFLGEL